MRTFTFAGFIALLLYAFAPVNAYAQNFISIAEETRTPPGWTQFCFDLGKVPECQPAKEGVRIMQFDNRLMQSLIKVNAGVNKFVKPTEDMAHWGVTEKWSYPTVADPRGDCEDYALLKRKLLMDAGFPISALLMARVFDQNGGGHALLIVRTDAGDYVLDDQNDNVTIWSALPYKFQKSQSPKDPNVWVFLNDSRSIASR